MTGSDIFAGFNARRERGSDISLILLRVHRDIQVLHSRRALKFSKFKTYFCFSKGADVRGLAASNPSPWGVQPFLSRRLSSGRGRYGKTSQLACRVDTLSLSLSPLSPPALVFLYIYTYLPSSSPSSHTLSSPNHPNHTIYHDFERAVSCTTHQRSPSHHGTFFVW